jgi:hypothetical protein
MPTDRSTSPLMPGFDFLKTLAGQAGKGLEGLQQLNAIGQGVGNMANGLSAGLGGLSSLSGLGGFKQWVAPTLDPDELEKRIEELRTVQFWLEQNARLLGATIQALEVQKMTLSTLRSMDVKMPDLQQVLGAMMPQAGTGKAKSKDTAAAEEASEKAAGSAADAANASTTSRSAAGSSSGSTSGGSRSKASAKADAKTPKGAPAQVDPMKWWGALTEQFQQLATQALASSTQAAASVGAGTPKSATAGAPRAKASAAKPRRAPAKRSRSGTGKG